MVGCRNGEARKDYWKGLRKGKTVLEEEDKGLDEVREEWKGVYEDY